MALSTDSSPTTNLATPNAPAASLPRMTELKRNIGDMLVRAPSFARGRPASTRVAKLPRPSAGFRARRGPSLPVAARASAL